MFTRRRLTVRTAPAPWQVGHGSSITVPDAAATRARLGDGEHALALCLDAAPLAAWGTRSGWFRAWRRCRGRSGRSACIGTCSGTCAPLTAWSKVIVTCASRSAPFSARGLVRTRRPLVEPPNRFDRMSPIEARVEVEVAEAAEAAAGPRAGGERSAAAVVLLALLGVAQHVVSLGDLLEARLGLLVVGVAVGVVLAREFAVGLLDLLRATLSCRPRASCSSRGAWPFGLLPLRRHDHAGGADDALAEPVAGLVDLDDGSARRAVGACAAVATASCSDGSNCSPSGEKDSMPARASAADELRCARGARPAAAGRPRSAASSARSRLSSAGSSSLARPVTPRSCAAAASRATRLR